ncbi:uncharacterized protein [Elaeis guineensis]|uniref:Uncharacterized protein LOC105042316 isoform X2 n=1 Tax=Elaeis guineensis var. tenera TaxID=51953 RepID=A0A6J0PFT0_ELAGV|nr:uncharacterized protein LOC105042316 isoform X2 [Elaeis guineensis]
MTGNARRCYFQQYDRVLDRVTGRVFGWLDCEVAPHLQGSASLPSSPGTSSPIILPAVSLPCPPWRSIHCCEQTPGSIPCRCLQPPAPRSWPLLRSGKTKSPIESPKERSKSCTFHFIQMIEESLGHFEVRCAALLTKQLLQAKCWAAMLDFLSDEPRRYATCLPSG